MTSSTPTKSDAAHTDHTSKNGAPLTTVCRAADRADHARDQAGEDHRAQEIQPFEREAHALDEPYRERGRADLVDREQHRVDQAGLFDGAQRELPTRNAPASVSHSRIGRSMNAPTVTPAGSQM